MMRQKKKLIMTMIILAAAVGITGLYFSDKARQKAESRKTLEESLTVDLVRESIQYSGDKDFDVMSLLRDSDSRDIRVTAEPETIDSSKTGETEVIFTVTAKDKYDQKVTKQIRKKITVKDTVKPKITLKKDKMEIDAHGICDIRSMIESVKDEVDGDLVYIENPKDTDKGYYTIDTGMLDTEKPGEYKVTIRAVDLNGLETRKELQVTVKEKQSASLQPHTPAYQNQTSSQQPAEGTQSSQPPQAQIPEQPQAVQETVPPEPSQEPIIQPTAEPTQTPEPQQSVCLSVNDCFVQANDVFVQYVAEHHKSPSHWNFADYDGDGCHIWWYEGEPYASGGEE